jgi:hypothetical protein
MTKTLVAFCLVLTTAQAFAFNYSCVSIDENAPYGINKIGLQINQKTAVLKLQDFDQDENYTISDYTPARSTPKRPMMKMVLVGTGNNSYGESALYEFFGDKELTTGGYALRDGKIGGFIKVTGHGYSWANYICFLK